MALLELLHRKSFKSKADRQLGRTYMTTQGKQPRACPVTLSTEYYRKVDITLGVGHELVFFVPNQDEHTTLKALSSAVFVSRLRASM